MRISDWSSDVCSSDLGRPGGTERPGVGAAAVEAGTVAGSQGGRLVEEEQLGPAAPAHDVAPHVAERAQAHDPGLGGPAPRQQCPGGGVVDDAAVAGEDGRSVVEGRGLSGRVDLGGSRIINKTHKHNNYWNNH